MDATNDGATQLRHPGDWDTLVEKIGRMTMVAHSIGASPAQLALAWCLRNPAVSTVILGATTTKQLKENFV